MANRWARSAKALPKADVRRDLNPALSLLEDEHAAVANIAALTAFDDTGLTSGAKLVQTFMDWFVLDRTSTASIDAVTVVGTKTGIGRWIRSGGPDLKWVTQATWYIDPTNGNDENAGGTPGTALKTHAELMRRWGGPSPLAQDVAVYLLDTLSEKFVLTFTSQKLNGKRVRYVGTTKTVHLASDTVTASQAINRGANLATTVTFAGLLAAHRGKKIRIVGGARDGAWSFIDKVTGTTARCAPFVAKSAAFSTSLTVVTPQVGDVIEIVSDIDLPQPYADFGSGGGGHWSLWDQDLWFYDVRFTGSGWVPGEGWHGGAVGLVGCDIANMQVNGGLHVMAMGSRVATGIWCYEQAKWYARACYVDGVAFGYLVANDADTFVAATDDTLFGQGSTIDGSGTIYARNLANFDNPYAVIIARRFGKVRVRDALYGSGNGSNGIIAFSSAAHATYSALASLTATCSAAFQVNFANGVTKTWAQLPFVANATAADSQASLTLDRG